MTDDAVAHRIGGADVPNLRLTAADLTAVPPGLSVLLGGTPQEAANQMRTAIRSSKWRRTSAEVGSATVAAVRAAGFEVLPVPTAKLPNHGRIVHPDGVAGFTDVNLARLSAAFVLTTGC